MTVPAIRSRKLGGTTAQPIVMLTAYTMRMAQLLDPHCEILLVGDSLGQVIYGLPSTVPVSMDMMCAHGAAVVRGSWHSLVAVDMPFGSYEASPEQAFASAARIMKESGCAGVKLEGGEAMAPTIASVFLMRCCSSSVSTACRSPASFNSEMARHSSVMSREIESRCDGLPSTPLMGETCTSQ